MQRARLLALCQVSRPLRARRLLTVGPIRRRVEAEGRKRGEARPNLNDLLAHRTSTTTDSPIPTTGPRSQTAVRRLDWLAGIVAVLGLTAAFVWGAVGTVTALDRVDGFDRVTIPGSMTVSEADPGTKARGWPWATTSPGPSP